MVPPRTRMPTRSGGDLVGAARRSGRKQIGKLPLTPGDQSPLLAVSAGKVAALGHSAEAYSLWYQIGLANGETGWVQAALPWTLETGSDGRASAIKFNFVPAAPIAGA